MDLNAQFLLVSYAGLYLVIQNIRTRCLIDYKTVSHRQSRQAGLGPLGSWFADRPGSGGLGFRELDEILAATIDVDHPIAVRSSSREKC